MAGIGSTPIGVFALVAFVLGVARSASLALETAKLKVKRRPNRKEVRMGRELIAGSALETAWAIGVGVLAGSLPSNP
jgi:hypothetical protein